MMVAVYGTVVREARLSRGMTQAELASISAVDQPNISAIENGRRRPSADTLHRLLHACGFELLATAGQRVLPLPPPEEPLGGPFAGAPSPGPVLSMEERVAMLTAALDAAEAILRNR